MFNRLSDVMFNITVIIVSLLLPLFAISFVFNSNNGTLNGVFNLELFVNELSTIGFANNFIEMFNIMKVVNNFIQSLYNYITTNYVDVDTWQEGVQNFGHFIAGIGVSILLFLGLPFYVLIPVVLALYEIVKSIFQYIYFFGSFMLDPSKFYQPIETVVPYL